MTTITNDLDNTIGHILDWECGDSNPLVIKLHCYKLNIYWERASRGYWNDEETLWTPGIYKILKIEVK